MALTDTVTGPQVEWQHKHSDAVLCIGDAVADFLRQAVPAACAKTALQRMLLKDPPNATKNMKCDICLKGQFTTHLTMPYSLTFMIHQAIAYDVWNQWCTHCDSFTCKTCSDTGRGGHRHAMNWTRVVKISPSAQFDFTKSRICDRCQAQTVSSLYQGLVCTVCRNYDCCLSCITKHIRPQHSVCGGKASTFEFLLFAT